MKTLKGDRPCINEENHSQTKEKGRLHLITLFEGQRSAENHQMTHCYMYNFSHVQEKYEC